MLKISKPVKVILGVTDILVAVALGYVAISGASSANWWAEWGANLLLVLLVLNGATIFLGTDESKTKK